MKQRAQTNAFSRGGLLFTLAAAVLLVAAAVYLSVCCGGNDLHAFAEPVLTLSDGWTITDSDGNARPLRLPETIDCGKDGRYTLSCTLPTDDTLFATPALRFYSNYVDVRIRIDGRELYAFPNARTRLSSCL